MLGLVLALVVAAFGLLVTALATSTMVWAWLSVAASVVAAITLAVDWRQRRRRSAAAPAVPEPIAFRPEAAERNDKPADDPAAEPPDGLDLDAEPPEEDTDAADVLTVSELEAEVRVVDERPRYHLATCRWLNDRATLPLPVREARELGFTPCSICTPDRALAAAHQ